MPGIPGAGGPVPKRSEERRRRNKVEGADRVRMTSRVPVPAASREWHATAKRWYRALRTSGQVKFFEPSDWAAAQYVAEAMTRNLNDSRFSGNLFASVWTAMDGLLTTEAARRRLRLEVERGDQGAGDEGPAQLSEYLERLRGS